VSRQPSQQSPSDGAQPLLAVVKRTGGHVRVHRPASSGWLGLRPVSRGRAPWASAGRSSAARCPTPGGRDSAAMHGGACRPEQVEGAEQQRLRAGIVRLGGSLGWDAPMVVRFSEAAAGCPLQRCGRPELLRILSRFADLAARMRARSQAAVSATSTGVALVSDEDSAHPDVRGGR